MRSRTPVAALSLCWAASVPIGAADNQETGAFALKNQGRFEI